MKILTCRSGKSCIRLQKIIQHWGNYSESVFGIPCDETAAKNDLLLFFGELKKCTPEDKILFDSRSYYSFLKTLLPLQLALEKNKYALACHELETLFASEPILQKRIYFNLMRLYERYLE